MRAVVTRSAALALFLATVAGGCTPRARPQFTFTMRNDAQWRVASNAHRLSEFPKVHEDGRVWFQFDGPATALSVQLRIGGASHDMGLDGNGLWNVVVPQVRPGFRIYSFIVDGVSYMDPGSKPYYVNGYVSALEVPGPGDEFYAVKDVPHGHVREHWFHSAVAGEFRRMFVYTPPGYDEYPDVRYPVLYLQHGGGELENEWVHAARANFILDNLLEEGAARPMIIVMNMGFVTRAGGTEDAFDAMLLEEVVPNIDANFRTLTDPEHRAMAGLSRGGGQTFDIGLAHTEVFGSLGVFSSGLFRNLSGDAFDREIPGLLSRASAFNDALDLFYISVGEQDDRLDATRRAVETFREHGLDVEFASFPGAHEWQVWRLSLHDFAQRLFE